MLHSADCASPKRAQKSRRKTHVAVVYVLGVRAQGWTPLHHACCAGRNTTVGYLLDKNANVNADNKNNETPLHLAFGNGHMEIIRLLMQVRLNPLCSCGPRRRICWVCANRGLWYSLAPGF